MTAPRPKRPIPYNAAIEALWMERTAIDESLRPAPSTALHRKGCTGTEQPLVLERVTGFPPEYVRLFAVFRCRAACGGTSTIHLPTKDPR